MVAWLVLAPLVLFVGFQQIFSTHANYDDEGYVMLSVVSFMEGKPLYDETYSQYGPFFYQTQSAFHRWTGLPITHDLNRLKTLGVWLAVSTLAMGFLFRESRSWQIATAGFLVTFFHLDRLCLEPGHPQELCVLAIMLVLILSTQALRSQRPNFWALFLGLTVGAALMVKLNVGVFLFVSSTLLLLLRGPKNPLGKLLLPLGSLGAVALPCLLTVSHLKEGMGFPLPFLCTLSLVGILLCIRYREAPPLPRFTSVSWLAYGVGVGLLVAFSCGMAILGGTSSEGLMHGLVGQHMAFEATFFNPAPIPGVVVVFAGLILYWALKGRDRRWIGLARGTFCAAILFCMLRYLSESNQPLVHGLQDRGAAGLLLGIAAPVLWILLLPGFGARQEQSEWFLGRLPLCLIAALQPMAAYPTPGTQMAIGTLVLALGSLLALHDLTKSEQDWLPKVQCWIPGMLLLLVCTLCVRGDQTFRYRESLTPLALPGADWMRVTKEKSEQFQWLVKTLQNEADTFVFGEHACNSFYFWTGIRPPTSLNPTFWPYLLGEKEQQRIITSLDESLVSAVVHQPFDAQLPNGPLLEYLKQHYRPALHRQATEVWLSQVPLKE